MTDQHAHVDHDRTGGPAEVPSAPNRRRALRLAAGAVGLGATGVLLGADPASATTVDGGSASSSPDTLQLRRDTTANWASANPTLAAGETGLDTTTGVIKVGDGTTAWNSLRANLLAPIVFDVRAFGAVGDGTTDDATAINAALTAAASGGIVLFPAGYDFYVGSTLTVQRTALTDQVIIDARGADITFGGSSGALLQFDGGGSHGNQRGPIVQGGSWTGNSNADECFKWTDAGASRFRDVNIYDFTKAGASAFRIRNDAAFSENLSFTGIRSVNNSRVVTYEPASVTGGSGTASFARQRWYDVFAGGGDDYLFYLQGGVYDGSFHMIAGNAGSGLDAVFYIGAGALGGTTVDNIRFEGGSTSTALFDITDRGTYVPYVGPNIFLRSGMSLVTGGSETDFIAFTPVGGITLPAGRTFSYADRQRFTFGTIDLTADTWAEIPGDVIVHGAMIITAGVKSAGRPLATWSMVKRHVYGGGADIVSLGSTDDGSGNAFEARWQNNTKPEIRCVSTDVDDVDVFTIILK